jgi:hypothetical protein
MEMSIKLGLAVTLALAAVSSLSSAPTKRQRFNAEVTTGHWTISPQNHYCVAIRETTSTQIFGIVAGFDDNVYRIAITDPRWTNIKMSEKLEVTVGIFDELGYTLKNQWRMAAEGIESSTFGMSILIDPDDLKAYDLLYALKRSEPDIVFINDKIDVARFELRGFEDALKKLDNCRDQAQAD